MKTWMKMLPALAVLAGAACGETADPTGVSAPDAAVAAKGTGGNGSGGGSGSGKSGPSINTADRNTYRLARGFPPDPQETSVSGVIGEAGGALRLTATGHMLIVPRGAVSRPTLFSMRVVSSGYVQVELNAYEPDSDGRWTREVGSRGFSQPVTLKLSYAWATDVTDPAALSVVWLVDGTATGRMQEMPSAVEVNNNWVRAELRHFSGYAIASGRTAE